MRSTAKKSTALLFLLPFFMGSNCDKAAFLEGDLGRVSSISVLPCEPFAGEFSQCLLLAQPWSQQIRVYDLKAQALVPSPTGLFPLAIKLGTLSNSLASSSLLKFSYALDSIDGKIYVTPTTFSAISQSFIQPENIGIYPGSSSLVFSVDENNLPVAVVAHPQRKVLTYIPVDSLTGLRDTTRPGRDFLLPFEPQILSLTADQKGVVVSSSTSNFIAIVRANNLQSIDVGVPTLQLSAGQMDLGEGMENFAVVLPLGKKEAILISLDREQVIKRFALDQLPVQVYVPQGNISSCCGGLKQWAIVISAFSKLSYLHLNNARGSAQEMTSIDLSDNKSLGVRAVLATAITPGIDSDSGSRESYISFETGLIAKFTEGSLEVKKLSAE